MNKWKVAFLTLLALIILGFAALIILMLSGKEDMPKPEAINRTGSSVNISTTPKEFEDLANTLIQNSNDTKNIQLWLEVDKELILKSNVEVLGVTVPVTLAFEPKVDDKGNLELYQTNVKVGMLDLPSRTALQLVRDSGGLPEWLTIQPSEKTAYIDLSSFNLPIDGVGTAHLRAKTFNLEKKEITLQIVIPKK